MLMSSSVASCSTSCRKGSAASVTSAFWRTPAALPSFQPSALLCKRRSRDPLLNPPIIASATQSSPVIVSIFAQSVVAPWSRSAFGRARHRGDPQRRAVTPHDDQPRTPFFAHLHADAPRRNVDPCPQNLARILASLICCQNTCDRPRTRNRPISSSSQFAHGSTVRANNPLSNRRRRARTPISPDQQHAASFNPASNRSRAELAAGCVTRGLFEPSSISGEGGQLLPSTSPEPDRLTRDENRQTSQVALVFALRHISLREAIYFSAIKLSAASLSV